MRKTLGRKLWRDLKSRKLSLASLAAVVSIGVACQVGMGSMWLDLTESIHRYYANQRLCDFIVDAKRVPDWAIADSAEEPNVRETRGRVAISAMLELPDRLEPISGQAFSMPMERETALNGALLKSGSWFSSDDAAEVVLHEKFAKANGLRPGDRIKAKLLDKQHDLLVVGTAISPEFVYIIPPGGGFAPDFERHGVFYAPERFLQNACDLEGAWNQVVGLLHDSSEGATRRTMSLVAERLDAFGVTNKTSREEIASYRFIADDLQGNKVTASVMPAIFLGVAALVLNVLVGRLALQQRTIIGTLKALGFSSASLTLHYLSFAACVGVAGGALGCLLGWSMQVGLIEGVYAELYALPSMVAKPRFGQFALGVATSVLFAVAGAIKGARSAASLQPAEAMRPPPPERGNHTPIERLAPAFWRRLPFAWKMILRDIFRNPFRSGVGVVSSLAGAALMVLAFSMTDALDYLMEYEYTRVSRDDVKVSLREPASAEATSRELASMPGASRTEPQLNIACELANGAARKLIGVTGLPKGNTLHTPLDADGLPIAIPSEGLVLTRKLATMLGAKPGASLRLRPLVGERREVVAPVVAVVDSYWGLSAYADIGYLSRLVGEEPVSNLTLGTVFKGADENALYSELRRRPSVIGIAERARVFTLLNDTFGKSMGAMLGVLIFFGGMIAFGAVLNASMVGLSEREREVGTLRVLGFTPRQVAGLFAGESLIVNGLGVVLGVLAGIGLSQWVSTAYDTEMFRFPVVILPEKLLYVALLMAAFVGTAQLIVWRMIAKLPWLDALKIKE
jgi:putative ABC transport system permease protein